jgi:predicted N-acetyltransferase YhbS
VIRPVRTGELPLLREIEVSAGESFRALGMEAVADDEPFSVAELDRYRRAGLAWVATDASERLVGYLVAEPVDGALHVAQVSVRTDNARRGIGSSLLEHLARHATENAVPALTLTTFAEVPWNAPYYERLGFRRLRTEEVTPGLRAIRRDEAAAGLDRWPRVCMRRDLPAP